MVKAAGTKADKLAVASANADWSVPALYVFLCSYVVFAAMTWFFCLRTSFVAQRVATFAHAGFWRQP